MTLDSLDLLEAKIQEAAERLAALAEENAELERQLQASEERFAALAVSSASASAVENGGATWRAERAELKRRVDLLVARLEDLLRAS